jgi:hypothetical protein
MAWSAHLGSQNRDLDGGFVIASLRKSSSMTSSTDCQPENLTQSS